MKDEFLNYYEKEIDFIRQMGAEFAAAEPVARELGLEANPCKDPHVERLLEGFAFLTARIRKKIDDEYPEITDALLSLIYPHYQQPIPSMAVVQFVPSADPTTMTGGHVIPRHVKLTAQAMSSTTTNCQFRSAYPVTLWPVTVESATLARDRVTIPGRPTGAVALLSLGLRCTSPEDWGSLEGFESLRFFLKGDELVSPALYECLFNDLCEVWVRGKVASGVERTIVLTPKPSKSVVEPVGFRADESILPYSNRSFPGYRLLQEYLAFPPKFLFFDLKYLECLRSENFKGPVEILFFLRQAPKSEVVIRRENFQLGCTPAINLFETDAQPFILNQLKTSYTVVPGRPDLNAYEIYSVNRVVGQPGGWLERPIEYQPFYSHRPGSSNPQKKEAYWFASRRKSLRKGDEGIEVELSFVDPNFSPMVPAVQKINIQITCTNRDLPVSGIKGDFEVEAIGSAVSRARLLVDPTPTGRPPLGRSAQWAAIMHLGLNYLSLIDSPDGPLALRELMTIYDFRRTEATQKMINSIVGVTCEQIAGRTGNRLGNTVCLGTKVMVLIDEEIHSGSGAFLTVSVLERFLGAYVTINSFTQMVARSKQRGGIWKRWPSRCGDRTLL